MTSEPHSRLKIRIFASLKIPERSGIDIAILGAIWFGSLLLVHPVGNFPLNDDWAFARTVKDFVETGKYSPSAWAAMPLLTQTLWGSLFCLPAGFSFNALRCSTLVMSLSGILATYLSLRYVSPLRRVAVLGALVLAFNPIYYALSNTFMTDVTFTALMMGSALFLFRNLQHGSRGDWILGATLALAATLSRQLGLAVPLSFAVCLIWMKGPKANGWARAIAPLLLCVAGLVAYQAWMRSTHSLSAASIKMNFRAYSVFSDVDILCASFRKNFGNGMLYLGWFTLPLMALIFPRLQTMWKQSRKFCFASSIAVVFVALTTMSLARSKSMMPTLSNILVVQGIGPLTLNEAYDNEPAYLPSIGKTFWLMNTAFAVAGGALLLGGAVALLARLWTVCRGFRLLQTEQAAMVFFPLSAAAYLFAVLALGGWDRYYMPVLPLILIGGAALVSEKLKSDPDALVGMGSFATGIRGLVCICLLSIMAVFSICGTHDYLEWNRARWKALDELMAGGKVTPKEVDGGFEFNGWYLYDPHFRSDKGKNPWWVHENNYMVTFGEAPGYRVIKEYPYQGWLPPRKGRILVLGK